MKNYDFSPHPNEPKFDSQRNSTEQEKDYLSIQDKKVLQRGLEKLWEMFELSNAKDLPTDIVFPEAAARPLFYAVKPVIDLIYTKKGQPLPKFHFIAVHSKQRNLENIQDFERDLGEKISIDTVEQEIGRTKKDELHSDDSEASYDSFLREQILNEKNLLLIHQETRRKEDLNDIDTLIFKSQDSLSSRFDTIFQTGQERVLIIDDYVDKYTTVDLLNTELFQRSEFSKDNEETSAEQLPTFFAFYGKTKESPEEKGMHVILGSDPTTKDLETYSGFYYRYESSLNPNKSARQRKEAEAALGVKKYLGEPYVSKADNQNPQKMRAIRNFFQYQGETFVKEKKKKVE